MENKKIDWGMEAVKLASEVSDSVKDVGIPGLGLIGKFAQEFYTRHLLARFSEFCITAEIDQELIEKIQINEDYSNCFYSILETVRKTHSKLGLITLALIYKDYWNDKKILIPAMRSLSEISDDVLLAFIELYESIPSDKNYVVLRIVKEEEGHFHHLYQDAVELIGRNIFLQSSYSGMFANGPIQGMKWDHTDLYYKYCVQAKRYI